MKVRLWTTVTEALEILNISSHLKVSLICINKSTDKITTVL